MQDFRRQVVIAVRWLPLLLIGALLAGGLAYMVASGQPKVYEASARLIVDPGQDPSVQDVALAEGAAIRYASQALSRGVLGEVIDELGLQEDPRSLEDRLSTSVIEETMEVVISARDEDPEAARLLALTIGEEMRERVREDVLTPEVREADQAIDDAQSRIKALQSRWDFLRRKNNKDQLERNEMLQLAGQISSLQQGIQFLQPSSRAFVRNLLRWPPGERPTTPTSPVEPRPLRWTLMAVVVGGMAAAALAFGLEYLRVRNRLRDEDDVEEATGMPVVGTIAEGRREARRDDVERLAMLRYPGGETAEAYRGMLARIGFASGSVQTLMIASSSPSDLKSVVAANVALAYAEAGRNVILVDADYRTPRLHKLFGVPNERGLTSVLANFDIPLGFVTMATSHPRLGLMPAGPPPRESSDPLGSKQLDALLRRLLQAADTVVFDSPAMAGNLDAAVLATHLQGSLLVVPAEGKVDEAEEAARVLQGAEADAIGAVMYRRVRKVRKGTPKAIVPAPQGISWWHDSQRAPKRIPVVSSSQTSPPPIEPQTSTAPRAASGPSRTNGSGPPSPPPTSPPTGPYATAFDPHRAKPGS